METKTRLAPRDHLVKRYLNREEDQFEAGRYTAIYKAKVVNTNDPQNRGRVLVRIFRFESINEIDANYEWAYVLNLLGGPANSGIFIVPPINSAGFIGYLDADGATAIWLGTSNLTDAEIKDEEGNIEHTVPALPVEMDNDPTTIVWKTQYPTRTDDVYNLNFTASGDDEALWIKAENLLKLSEDEFTILKYNQGRTSKDGYTIGYTYNYESYTIDDDVMMAGEIEDSEDNEDPLNQNYSNFFRIKNDELRLFYRTKVKKPNENQEEVEHSAYNTLWMNDDGVSIGDVWGSSLSMARDGIHFVSSITGDEAVFELKDDWGNFLLMQQNGIWMHGSNPDDNPQVSDPSGDYEFGTDFETLRFNNETPGLIVNTLGSINMQRVDGGGNPLELLSVDDGLIKISTANDQGSIKIEQQLITITDSLGTFKLDTNDIKSESMNFKVTANANVELIGNAKVNIIGNAKVAIGNLVDIGAAVAAALNKSALIISPGGTAGGPCSIPFGGQVFVKI